MLDSARYYYEETIVLLGKEINVNITKKSYSEDFVALAYFKEDEQEGIRLEAMAISMYKGVAKNKSIIALVQLAPQKELLRYN